MSEIVQRLHELSRWLLKHDVDMKMPAGMIDPEEAADIIARLEAEVERLREALEWYASDVNWLNPERARAALTPSQEPRT